MQSTASVKRPGSALPPNSTGGIVAPHTECRAGSGRNCRVTDPDGTALIIPTVTVKFSSPPSNSRTTPSPSKPGFQPPPSHNPGGGSGTTVSPAGPGSLNIWLIVAIACGGALVLLLVVCIIYRCRHKADEGSYSVEHHQREFGGDPACKPLRRIPGDGEPLHMNGSAATMDSMIGATDASIGTFSRGDRCSTPSDRKKKKKKAKPGRKETREWYV